ncbi:MAG: outer membrane lipoprotein-sorting protein [Candidatus Pacebacteria bacterium]|nr:outer membrane lipoprotein-sorting protein [Candidatus Paceibacterota bacterium]
MRFLFCILFSLATTVAAQETVRTNDVTTPDQGDDRSPPDARTIVEIIDQLYRSDSSYSEVAMDIVTPHWERTLEMNVWTEGTEKTFIRILSPRKERGMGTLRIGREMWNYLPKVNKVIKIPPSMMMSSWMGSDFTNDDLVKEFTFAGDYHFSLVQPEYAQDGVLYIECHPKEGRPIIWGKVMLAVREEDYLPVWQRYYDEKDNVMRVLEFSDIRALGGRRLPSVLTMIRKTEKGHKTVLHYKELKFNVDVSGDIFTLRHLRSRL